MEQKEIDTLFIARREKYNAERKELMAELNAVEEKCKYLRRAAVVLYQEDVEKIKKRLHDLNIAYSAENKTLAEQYYQPTPNTPEKALKRTGGEVSRAAEHIVTEYAEKGYPVDAENVSTKYNLQFNEQGEHEIKIEITIKIKNDGDKTGTGAEA